LKLRDLEKENQRLNDSRLSPHVVKGLGTTVSSVLETTSGVTQKSTRLTGQSVVSTTPKVEDLFSKDWKEKPQVEAHSIHKSSFSGDSLASSWSDNGTMVHGVHDKPWYIIDPESSWYASGWQMIVGVALVFVAFLTPLQIGLFDIRFDSMLLVSLAVDFIFLVDLILQFFVMISVSTFHGLKREVRLSRVGLKYLKTWFFIDALAVVPWDLIGVLHSDTETLAGARVIRVVWMLKMLRLMKPSRIIHKIEIPYSIPYQQQLALFRFLGFLVIVCHWLACVWAMTLKVVDKAFPRWIDEISTVDSSFGFFEDDRAVRTYIAAFYFCSYTMTSVGYGDIGPQNILERIVCTVMVMLSGLFWAYVIGQVCTIVADISAESQEFRHRMHHLNMMMEEEHLPHQLKSRVREFFMHNRDQARHLTQQPLLDAMSPQLKAEVATVVNFPWLERVIFFNRFVRETEELQAQGVSVAPYRACIADIVRELKSVAYAQGEFVSNVRVLSILSKGLVLRSHRLEHKGSVWGEDFVLSDRALVRRVDFYALTYIEVLCLSRDDFMDIIEKHSLTCPRLGQIVRRYCVRVAVRRGILAEAKRRVESMSKPLPSGTSGLSL